jgi:protein-L-isoaspartate(D-aspartate) O-methyltransferase
LVDELREKGIRDEAVLAAINAVPRHFFLDKAFEEIAYEDRAFPIGADQTISQPYTVAYQTSLLEVHAGDSVLEIGTGSGYQACVLAAMGANVCTLERQESLYRQAQVMFMALGYDHIRAYFRDGYLGIPELAPFDKILVTCGAPEIPETLKDQLRIGGTMVIPVDEHSVGQRMTRLKRTGSTSFEVTRFDLFKFVPFLRGRS